MSETKRRYLNDEPLTVEKLEAVRKLVDADKPPKVTINVGNYGLFKAWLLREGVITREPSEFRLGYDVLTPNPHHGIPVKVSPALKPNQLAALQEDVIVGVYNLNDGLGPLAMLGG